MNQPSLARYHDRVENTPPAGYGKGFNNLLLGTANLAVSAGITLDQFLADMIAIPHARNVQPECVKAYLKAHQDQQSGAYVPPAPVIPAVSNGPSVRSLLIEQGWGADEADLWEASPIRLGWPTEQDAVAILHYLYSDDDWVFMGDLYDAGTRDVTIRRVKDWKMHLNGHSPPPHIIPNALNGLPSQKKTGDGQTCRGDSNVASFRFCIVEHDDLTREEQCAFWAAVDLPISVLIDTAGKSIHGWLDCRRLASISNLEEWDHHIKNRLYKQVLIPLGVDPACCNPGRLSRLPGHYRGEKGRLQRILYLSPNGQKVF